MAIGFDGGGHTHGTAVRRPGRDPDGCVLITKRSGVQRALALPAEVPGLLDFAVRTRPDGAPFPSVAAHGLWSCVGSKSDFEDWFKERAWRLALREGIDFFPAPSDSDAVHHIDVLSAVMLVHGSQAEAGRAAADFLDGLRRRMSLSLADGAAEQSVAAATPHGFAAADLPAHLYGLSLDVARRALGSQDMAVVSARDLHAIVDPAHQFAIWWRRTVKAFSLDEGEDYATMVPGRRSAGERGRAIIDYWLPLRVARKAGASAPAGSREALAAYLRAWTDASPPRPAWRSSGTASLRAASVPLDAGHLDPVSGEDPAPGDVGAEPEPWAEAFDFGRLVPVAERGIGGAMRPTVSARDVHTFLGIAKDFTDWWKAQIERLSLMPGDFTEVFPPAGENPSGGRPRRDFLLSLSAAKKVSMASSGRRGNAVREYFIECERRLLAGEPSIPSAVQPIEPPAPAPNPLPDGAYQPSMPERDIPLTMPDFLRRIGMMQARAEAVAADKEGVLLRAMLSDGLGALVGYHPIDRRWLVFDRKALDAWWCGARVAALADPAALVASR